MSQGLAFVLHKCPEDGDISGYDGVGWYFRDECYALHGPFCTEGECEKIAKGYLEHLG